jgi:hypothetical protein
MPIQQYPAQLAMGFESWINSLWVCARAEEGEEPCV